MIYIIAYLVGVRTAKHQWKLIAGSEVLPLAQDGIFNGVHVLRGNPIYPVSGQFSRAELEGLEEEMSLGNRHYITLQAFE